MPDLNQIFAADASRLNGKIMRIGRAKGRMSQMIKKEVYPNGMGFNPVSLGTLRSNPVGGGGWVTLATPDGESNNCMPEPSVVTPALNTLAYTIEQTAIKSYPICLTDGRFGYEWEQQVANSRENFAGTIVDTWEDRTKYWYQYWSPNKIIYNTSLTTGSGTAFPNVEATYYAGQELLDPLWQQIIQNGGGEEYGQSNGQALIPLIMSPEASREIIKGSSAVREDFRFAEMGKGAQATLLKSWGSDKPYGGFLHVIDPRMKRYNFTNGAYVEVPYYADASSTIGGDQSIVNPDYTTAGYEVMYVFHSEAVIRQTPTPMGSLGSDTKFRATNYNGDIGWFNIPNETTNLFSAYGVYAAQLIAAFKPSVKRQYSYAIMLKRCPNIVGSVCSY